MKNEELFGIIRLIALAAATLYFELAIIRFTSAEVISLGYFSNFMLITSFVGLGVGFLSYSRSLRLEGLIPYSLLFIIALVLVSEFDVNILTNHFGLFFFGNVTGRAGIPGALLLLVLFVSTATFFACLGNCIADAFTLFKPIKAYTYDILGSLIGIGIFTVQSLFSVSPPYWIVTGTVLLAVGLMLNTANDPYKTCLKLGVSCLCVVVLMLSSAEGNKTIWSTYQKLEVVEQDETGYPVIFANSIMHQFMYPAEKTKDWYYSVPYTLSNQYDNTLDDVLIIGAGSGTDVTTALYHGAKNIDAVDIDAGIVSLGKQFHPDRPYEDERVKIHIADGRNFLQSTDKKYDLIVYALPDSLTRLSSFSSVRLESYLFTKEAFHEVNEHLKPNGIFIMYNQYRWTWLINKISATIEVVFGKPPLLFTSNETVLLAVGDKLPSTRQFEIEEYEGIPEDDWPFVYLRYPTVHWLYLAMIGMFLITSLSAVHFLAPKNTLKKPMPAFFFMGVAFLLLETKSLAFFALLFGTTWLVNSFAFAGILLSILIANFIIQKFRIQLRWPLYAGLFLCIAIAYLIPQNYFLSIDNGFLRYFLAISLVFSPVLFANLIFSREFRDTQFSTQAFGWNLLGAVAGGGMEYLSLMFGYRNLLWIVAVCYFIAWIFTKKELAKQ